jgi:ankyrin repeat domain-containing protein 50
MTNPTVKNVKLPVQQGADVNMPLQSEKYNSALVAAAVQGRTKIVEFLVQHGDNVNMPLHSGMYGSGSSRGRN